METVNSYNVEFGYELLSAVPYAYWLHQRGELQETISATGSEALYYFSPNHTINPAKRVWRNMQDAIQAKVHNIAIHTPYIDLSKWATPDYKGHYANDVYKWDKPTICICNRYNIEWDARPINFFSLDCLERMFTTLKDKYQIVYFGVDLPEQLQDQAHSMTLGDYTFCKEKHPEVIIFQDLLKGGKDWNTTLLSVFANCERFITMNGGYSILASFFGGQNIIYSKQGRPQTKEIIVGSFWRWYPEINNSQVMYVADYDELYNKIQAVYVEQKPTVNIIIRTCQRPNYFKNCIQSIECQTYPNINVIIGVEESEKYTKTYAYEAKHRIVHYPKAQQEVIAPPKNNNSYGNWFPYNSYLDILTQKVGNGWVMYLDDDDILNDHQAIEKIMNEVESDSDMVYWRVQFHQGIIIPTAETWQAMTERACLPVVCDISGIGFLFHSKYKEQISWGFWKRGDFRVINKLHQITKKKHFINDCLVALQEAPHHGRHVDKIVYDEPEETIKFKKMILVKLKSGVIRQTDELTGQQLIKTGYAVFAKDNEMVKIDISQPVNAFGRRINKGVVELEYDKARLLEMEGCGKIIAWEIDCKKQEEVVICDEKQEEIAKEVVAKEPVVKEKKAVVKKKKTVRKKKTTVKEKK